MAQLSAIKPQAINPELIRLLSNAKVMAKQAICMRGNSHALINQWFDGKRGAKVIINKIAVAIETNISTIIYSYLYADTERFGLRRKAMPFNTLLEEFRQFLQAAQSQLPLLLLGVVIFVIFYWLSSPIAKFISKPLIKTTTSQLIQLVIRRTSRLLIILLGLYFLMRLAGLTEFALALLSGTGVLGLIVGFAFKDIAENFLSSLLLSMQRPFKIGDIIEVVGYLGVVNKMTSRATTLVDFNGDHIQLPNATIYKNAIRNLTANPNMREFFDIGIGYDTDIGHAQALAMQLLTQQSVVLQEPEPQVLVHNLGAATCNLRVYFWVNAEINSQLKVASVLMKQLVNLYLEQGISMPDEARERIILSNQTVPVSTEQTTELTEKPPVSSFTEDTSSDHDEIREQAAQARDPEQGQNIL